MFYSADSKRIANNSSFLDSRKVFSGHYWDEFGLTSHLVPDGGNVLMLGLSFGGGIRPILASSKNLRLTCVDIDAESSRKCREFFDRHFPDLNFEVKVADATEFLQKSKEHFDAIWFDIFDASSYLNLSFQPEIYDLIKKRLTPSGVVLFNAYGLPNQFSPLKRQGAQAAVAHILQTKFGFVTAVPFRRNLTLIASQSAISLFPSEAHPELSNTDAVSLQLAGLKLKELLPLPEIEPSLRYSGDFQSIDAEMRLLWSEVLQGLKKYNIVVNSPVELLELIQNQSRCELWLDRAVDESDELVAFLPILAAGESALRELDVAWMFEWTFANSEKMKTRLPHLYRQIWLPQVWSLQLQSNRYRSHYFRLLALIQKDVQ